MEDAESPAQNLPMPIKIGKPRSGTRENAQVSQSRKKPAAPSRPSGSTMAPVPKSSAQPARKKRKVVSTPQESKPAVKNPKGKGRAATVEDVEDESDAPSEDSAQRPSEEWDVNALSKCSLQQF